MYVGQRGARGVGDVTAPPVGGPDMSIWNFPLTSTVDELKRVAGNIGADWRQLIPLPGSSADLIPPAHGGGLMAWLQQNSKMVYVAAGALFLLAMMKARR